MIQLVKRFGAERVVAVVNVVVAVVLAFVVFRVLPVRSSWTAVPALALIALLAASTVGLALGAGWGAKATRAAGLALFWAGLVSVGALVLGMVFSRGVTGAAAWPSMALFALSLLVVLPYTVVYGLGLLVWLPSRAGQAAPAARAATAAAAELAAERAGAEGAEGAESAT